MSAARRKPKPKAQKPVLLDAMVPSEHLIVRNELEAKSRSVDMLTAQVQEVHDENTRLTASIRQLEYDHSAVVNGLEARLVDKDKQIKRLYEEMKALRTKADEDRLALSADYEAQLARVRSDLAEANKELDERNEERAAIDKWRKMRDKMTEELENLKKEVETSQKKHKEDLLDMRRQQQLQRRQWKIEKEQEIEQVQERAKKQAQSEIDRTIATVLEINEELRRDREVYETKTKALNKKNQEYMDLNRELARDKALNLQMHEQHAKKGQRQAKLIRELNRKVASLETALSSIVREFDAERERILNQTTREIEDKRLEAEGYQKLLDVKNRELRNVKRLAQTILDARSELEQFFLDSLAEVKKEIRAERAAAFAADKAAYEAEMKAALTTRGGKFPTIRSFNATARKSATSSFADLPGASPGGTGGGGGSAGSTVRPLSGSRRAGSVGGGGGGSGPGGSDRRSSRRSSVNSGLSASRRSGAGPPDETFLTGVDIENAPSESGSQVSTSTAPPGLMKVDIKELSWEERERVLRLLFEKMNAKERWPTPSNGAASPASHMGGSAEYAVATPAT